MKEATIPEASQNKTQEQNEEQNLLAGADTSSAITFISLSQEKAGPSFSVDFSKKRTIPNPGESNLPQIQNRVIAPQSPDEPTEGKSKTSKQALLSFLLGLGSMLLSILAGALFGWAAYIVIIASGLIAVAALFVGIKSLKTLYTNNEKGKGFAITGIILGALGAIYLLAVIVTAIFLAFTD